MKVDLGNATVGGEYKLILRNETGEITQESDWNNNLLTDIFFTSDNFSLGYGFVGVGSTNPAPTDTKLASIIAVASSGRTLSGSASVTGNSTTGFVYTSASSVFSWALGAIVGNISEWGWAASNNLSTYSLAVRSLIKDTNGNPTTITITSSDQLEIWWRLSKKWIGAADTSSVTANYNLNGVATQVTCKNLNPSIFNSIGAFSSGIGPAIVPAATIRTIVNSSASVVEIQNAASGSNLTSAAAISAEQSTGTYLTPTFSNPTAGTSKFTWELTAPLLASAATAPMQLIVLDTVISTVSTANKVLAALTFNPQFVKGADKILTATFSYTVNRAP